MQTVEELINTVRESPQFAPMLPHPGGDASAQIEVSSSVGYYEGLASYFHDFYISM